MKSIKAKFQCNRVEDIEGQELVNLTPVASGSEENKSFSEATPCGNLDMTITNQSAKGFFEQGQEYFLDFTKA